TSPMPGRRVATSPATIQCPATSQWAFSGAAPENSSAGAPEAPASSAAAATPPRQAVRTGIPPSRRAAANLHWAARPRRATPAGCGQAEAFPRRWAGRAKSLIVIRFPPPGRRIADQRQVLDDGGEGRNASRPVVPRRRDDRPDGAGPGAIGG